MNSFRISHLFAHRFRNLESFSLHVHAHLNVFFGDNGQGKTNIIEAISIGLSTKSLRPVKHTKDLLTHGHEEGRIAITCEGESAFESSVSLFENGKKYRVAGKPIKDFSSLLDRVAVVSFVPDELQIVSASSSFRRRVLNQIASGFFSGYLGLYRRYERALLSRNQLLKSAYCDPDELASFDQVYAQIAAEITRYRVEATALWLPYFLASIEDIVGGRYEVGVNYAPSTSTDFTEALLQIRKRYPDEHLRRYTLTGPHLDDLVFTIDGEESRFLASRGQARAIVLAVKLGQLNAIAQLRKTPTVLLLDDVASELDPEKVRHLMATIDKLNIQTFLTTTHLESLFDRTQNCATFEIVSGCVK